MQTPIPLLQNVKVASPCPAAWSAMTSIEGDRVKFCDGCNKNVYNISAMTQAEAEGLLRKHEGHLCVRYYQRRDGTILTKDCPVGVQAVRQMFLRRSVATAALFLLGWGVMAARMQSHPTVMGEMAYENVKPVVEPTMGAVAIQTPPEPTEPRMGRVVVEEKAIMGNPIMGGVPAYKPQGGQQTVDHIETEKAPPDEQNDHEKP